MRRVVVMLSSDFLCHSATNCVSQWFGRAGPAWPLHPPTKLKYSPVHGFERHPSPNLNVGCLLLRRDRCLLLRQDRCLLLRQDRCLLSRQDRCLLQRQDRCKIVRQGAALSHYFTSVLSLQKTSVLSQQQTPVLSKQQTSVLPQQQTSVLSQHLSCLNRRRDGCRPPASIGYVFC